MMLGCALTLVLSAQVLIEHTLGPTRARPVQATSTPEPAPIESMFPLRPKLQLRAHNSVRIDFKFPVARPLCLLGNDAYSRQWLKYNAKELLRAGALCYLIEAPNAGVLAPLRALAPGVPITTINDAVFVQAGLRGYPAVISRTGVVQ
jgi:integrating conjugative element protein (TIGR03765 family)